MAVMSVNIGEMTAFEAHRSSCQTIMAENEADSSCEASGSMTDGDYSAGPVSLKSPEDESSDNPASHYDQDLKSVLVTSVLNLEKLDVDLYR